MNILTIAFLVAVFALYLVKATIGLQDQAGALIAVLLVLVLHGMSRRATADVILHLRGAREIHPSEAPWLYGLVEELTLRHRIRMPKLCLLPGKDEVAYVVGGGTRHLVVAITEGMFQSQAETTLRGILTDELLRNRRRHWVIGAVVAATTGAMMMLALSGKWE